MKLKDRIKSTAFWAGLIGTLFLILGAFGIEIGDDTASTVVNSVCSILALFGIIRVPQTQPEDSVEELCIDISQSDEHDDEHIDKE